MTALIRIFPFVIRPSCSLLHFRRTSVWKILVLVSSLYNIVDDDVLNSSANCIVMLQSACYLSGGKLFVLPPRFNKPILKATSSDKQFKLTTCLTASFWEFGFMKSHKFLTKAIWFFHVWANREKSGFSHTSVNLALHFFA